MRVVLLLVVIITSGGCARATVGGAGDGSGSHGFDVAWAERTRDGPLDGADADGPVADGPVADGPVADGPVADGPVVDSRVADSHPKDGPRPDTCPSNLSPCSGGCVDLRSSEAHCGICGHACGAGEVCCSGTCANLQTSEGYCGSCTKSCGSGETCCSGTCKTTSSDRSNCGGCGVTCGANEPCCNGTCATIGCANGTAGQGFTHGMRGCVGTVTFGSRATLCSSSCFKVCSARNWVDWWNGAAPANNYWTNDWLDFSAGNPASCYPGNCAAGESGTGLCTTQPMRVCAGNSDSQGNTCSCWGCGYQGNTTSSAYFGGCNNPSSTAGTLCCPINAY